MTESKLEELGKKVVVIESPHFVARGILIPRGNGLYVMIPDTAQINFEEKDAETHPLGIIIP